MAKNKFLLIAAGVLCVFCYIAYKIYIYTPTVYDYYDAKRVLERYVVYDNRITLYCGARFDKDKRIYLEPGFETVKYRNRVKHIEWEHAVPAARFGRSFKAWTEGDPICMRGDKAFKGRKCAEEAEPRFRKMEADMYNLFPAIGAVNAGRGEKTYAELDDVAPAFGSCEAKIKGRFFEPPDRAKGQVARAALYMNQKYENLNLGQRELELMQSWNRRFPVVKEECIRAKRIERIQKNENPFIKGPCQEAGWW